MLNSSNLIEFSRDQVRSGSILFSRWDPELDLNSHFSQAESGSPLMNYVDPQPQKDQFRTIPINGLHPLCWTRAPHTYVEPQYLIPFVGPEFSIPYVGSNPLSWTRVPYHLCWSRKPHSLCLYQSTQSPLLDYSIPLCWGREEKTRIQQKSKGFSGLREEVEELLYPGKVKIVR